MVSKSFPLVTLGMPVFNGEQWLDQAIGSLVKQDYPNTEILIVDDHSSDSSWDICRKYSSKYKFIKTERNPVNLGGIANYRNILHKAEGKYFSWVCQDDFWEPDFVSMLVAELQSDTEAIIAMGGTLLYTSDDKYIGKAAIVEPSNSNFTGYFAQAFRLLYPFREGLFLKNNFFLHGVINTSVLKKADRTFYKDMIVDRHYLLQLALIGKWLYVDKILFHRRIHADLSRRENDPITIAQSTWYYPIKGSIQMLHSVFLSKLIPPNRKIYAVPIVIRYLCSGIGFGLILRKIVKNILPDTAYKYIKMAYRKVRAPSKWYIGK